MVHFHNPDFLSQDLKKRKKITKEAQEDYQKYTLKDNLSQPPGL